MSILEAIEQKAIFRFTRFLSFLIILILCVAIGFAISFYSSITASTNISMGDMRVSMAPPPMDDTTAQKAPPTADIPPAIAKYLTSDEERSMFLEGITTLEPEQQKDFMSNLGTLIHEGEQKGLNISDLITQYKMVKISKFSGNDFDKYTLQAQRAAIIFLVLMLIGVIALFSLVLVLLAIERNTRPKTP